MFALTLLCRTANNMDTIEPSKINDFVSGHVVLEASDEPGSTSFTGLTCATLNPEGLTFVGGSITSPIKNRVD